MPKGGCAWNQTVEIARRSPYSWAGKLQCTAAHPVHSHRGVRELKAAGQIGLFNHFRSSMLPSAFKPLDEGFFRFEVRIMPTTAITAFESRKMPLQARATVTVQAISEATIQILLSVRADRLTTTRVAERAGVSVGTLYQYYPNKQSLLFAIFEDHLDKVSELVEAACAEACHKPMFRDDPRGGGSICRCQAEPR